MVSVLDGSVFQREGEKFAVVDNSHPAGMGFRVVEYQIVLWSDNRWEEITTFDRQDIPLDDPTVEDIIEYAENWIDTNW
jgi:hypothetical protein